jgi:hypothetical protein
LLRTAESKEVSRKGAKERRKEQAALNNFAFLLCAFAPLRATFFP